MGHNNSTNNNVYNWSLVRNINKGYGILSASMNQLTWKSYSIKNTHKNIIDYFSIIK
jgi:hypothetical protein